MGRSFVLLLTGIFMISSASADSKPSSYFFKIVPMELAHTFSGVARNRDFSADSIKVLVWNIKKSEMSTWQNEFNQYGKDRDLFLIQEAYQNDLFKTTLGSFSDVRWDMGISFLYRRYADTATGSMVGAKAEPTFVKVLHSPDFEPVTETPKATTFAKYPIEGSQYELLVISVHGINLTAYDTFQRHMLLAKAEIDNHIGPVLFAGDFNTRTEARTRFLEDMVKQLNLKAVDFKNGQCRMKFKFTPYYLDHSYIRGLDVKNAEVDCASTGSDHRPMILDLALSKI